MTLGSHQKTVGKSQIHITPRWILDRLGPFGLDPCAAVVRPWDCAAINWTVLDDGLSRRWPRALRVWVNAPFDRYQVARWIQRLADHGRGTALLHVRSETNWFEVCWQHASGMLFLDKRIKFCRPDGSEHPHNSGAPVMLVAFGDKDLAQLRDAGIAGWLVTDWRHIGAQRKSAAATGDLFARIQAP